jgi:autotransporter-associated beta strand protein
MIAILNAICDCNRRGRPKEKAQTVSVRSFCRAGTLAVLRPVFVLGLLASAAHADVYSWSSAGAIWSDASNWGGTAPGSADVGQFDLDSYPDQPTVTAGTQVGGIWVTGSGGVTITGSALTIESATINGNSATGIEMDPGAGALTISSSLALGAAQTWLNNSGSLLTAGSIATAGNTLTIAGSSNFALSNISGAGGGLTMLGSGLLQLSGSNTYTGATITNGGTLQLTGGQLKASTLQYVGSANTASFVQSAGTVGAASGLYIGYTATGNGSYTLTTGSLGSPGQYIGYQGSGSFSQLGGINTSSGTVCLGYDTVATGSYTLSAGTLNGANQQQVGYSGSGSFTQSGGLNSSSGSLLAGYNATGVGSYSLSAGTLTVPTQVFGYSGTGTFNQLGGRNTASTALYMGYGTTGIGSYNLTDGTLASPTQYIGYNGTATFSQSGGVNTASATIYMGYSATPGIGYYNLSGGSTYAKTTVNVGYLGEAEFTQTGGTMTTPGSLYIGNSGGLGIYNQSAGVTSAPTTYLGAYYNPSTSYIGEGYGSLSGGVINNSSATYISYGSGYGSFSQTGGTANMAEVLLGDGTAFGANYSLSDGLLATNFLVAGFFNTGSAGTMTQTGGTAVVSGNLYVSYVANASGLYNMSGGSIYSVNPVIIGYGNGYPTYSGGSGTFNMMGGTISTSNIWIGDLNGGVGVFSLSGGSVYASGQLIEGNNAGGNGTLNVTGGELTLSYSGGAALIGYGGVGSVVQSGGTINCTPTSGGVELGTGASAAGYYTQTGGLLTTPVLSIGGGGIGAYNLSGSGLLSTGPEVVGDSGSGVFTQSDGTNSVGTVLILGNSAGSVGTYNLNGGLLVVAGDPFGGYGIVSAGSAQFNFGGGTIQASGSWFAGANVPMTLTNSGMCTIETNGNNVQLFSQITGPGGLLLSDTNGGSLILYASNGYSGGTTISSGSLQIANPYALGAGPLAVDGGTFDLSGYSVIVPSFSGAAGTVTNNGSTLALLIVSQSGTTTTFSGSIQDGAAQTELVLSGGILVLNGTNTYSGGTYITDGVLVLESTAAMPDNSSLIVGIEASSLFAPAVAALSLPRPVPEPSPLGLLGLAAAALLGRWSSGFSRLFAGIVAQMARRRMQSKPDS